ncbi:MAG: DUF362 domain-containing protein [Clostridia bacterium]|nr:DUF362 domain-containing protein [Clostridia bacterium]
MKSKVYFSSKITPEKVLELYTSLGKTLTGKVAAKVHSGEEGNQNFLRPVFWKPIIDSVGATVVECNTAYDGARNETKKHKKLLIDHGWDDLYDIDLMDGDGPDLSLPIPDGKAIKENLVGKNIVNYDSMLVLSHFKGHPMGGFGGALKQLSIGCASSRGKCIIHSGGKTDDQNIIWENTADQDVFLEAMAEAASTVTKMFGENIAYINIMCNLSVDCDCCAIAEDPCMKDIGILASCDPVAIDQACIDLIYSSKDSGRDHMVERIETRHGIHTIERAAELGLGNREYDLIKID